MTAQISTLSRGLLFLLAFSMLRPPDAAAWERGQAGRFATLSAGAANPEGITVGQHGDVYATPSTSKAPTPENCSSSTSKAI